MLQKLFVFLLLFLILPDLYLYARYIVRRVTRRSMRILYWIPTFLLTIGLIHLVCFGNQETTARHAQAIGWFSIFFFLFIAPKLVLTFFGLLGDLLHKCFHVARTPFTGLGLVVGLFSAFLVFYGAFVGRTRWDVKRVSYTSTKLPASFNGYRIVQLSDIHIGSWQGNEEAIRQLVDRVNAQQPDLIVFTGDLVNHRADELNDFQDILSKLEAKDGVYSVLGNHDYGPYFHWKTPQEQADNLRSLKQKEKDMGWKLLNNEHVIIRHDNDSIALIGVENDGEPPFSQYADLPKATEGTQGMFSILLSHNPTHWRREVLPTSDIDIMLSGHTHAMQFIIGKSSPSSLIYPEWKGMYYEGERALYVNIGIGYVGLPFRFGAWPEITVLTLRQ